MGLNPEPDMNRICILWNLPRTDSMAAAESGSTNERLIWLGPYSPLLATKVSVSKKR